MPRTFLSGADLVLPDRVLSGQTIVIEGERLVEYVSGPRSVGEGERRIDRPNHLIVPGFIDVHVHGVIGHDVLDGDGAVARIAAALPRWGVTAFCPTTVASTPAALAAALAEVKRLRSEARRGARVLPAHLGSHFVNPEYRGAQPLACLRRPPGGSGGGDASSADFSSRDVLAVIDRSRPDVGIITMAPELEHGLSLLRAFVAGGVRVSMGHSGATYEE